MLDLDAIEPRSYEFRHNGRTYAVPTLDSLEADVLLDLVDGGSVDATAALDLFLSVLDEHAPGAREGMTLAKLKLLLADWQKSGNVGESSPSSD